MRIFLNPMTLKASPVSHRTIKQYGGTSWRAKRAHFPPLSRSTAHALKTFSAEEPWALEWIRIPSDTCGRTNSIWIRYVWTGKFLNPERKSCRFKNIRIRVDGALECKHQGKQNFDWFIMWDRPCRNLTKAPSTRIRIFFNPQLFLSRYKNFPVHTYPMASGFTLVPKAPLH